MRVKVVGDAMAVGFPSAFAGQSGTVTDERKFGRYDMRVRLDDGVETWFAKEELRPA